MHFKTVSLKNKIFIWGTESNILIQAIRRIHLKTWKFFFKILPCLKLYRHEETVLCPSFAHKDIDMGQWSRVACTPHYIQYIVQTHYNYILRRLDFFFQEPKLPSWLGKLSQKSKSILVITEINFWIWVSLNVNFN